jgi:hypothetical protein
MPDRAAGRSERRDRKHEVDKAVRFAIGDLGRVFLLDLGDVVRGVDPFFHEAASATQTPCYFDGTEEGPSGEDIVGIRVFLPDFNEVGGSTLWARL